MGLWFRVWLRKIGGVWALGLVGLRVKDSVVGGGGGWGVNSRSSSCLVDSFGFGVWVRRLMIRITRLSVAGADGP